MDADWITSPSARRVLQHAGDSRPAWLWSQDGQALLWHNDASELFLAKLKKHGLRLPPPALPIKGQIARNIRLGSIGRTSLARIQLLVGDKPTSTTCATTPLTWQDGQTVLLVVGVDAIAPEILAAAVSHEPETVQPDVTDAADVIPAAAEADEHAADEASPPEADGHFEQPPTDSHDVADAGKAESAQDSDAAVAAAREALDEVDQAMDAGEDQPRPSVAEETVYARELESWRAAEPDGTAALELVASEPDEPSPEWDDTDAHDAEPSSAVTVDQGAGPPNRLSLLVDRLAEDSALFTPLSEADDAPPMALAPVQPSDEAAEPESLVDDTAGVTAALDEAAVSAPLFKVTGRGFVPDIAAGEFAEPEEPASSDMPEVTEAEADLADLAAIDGTVEAALPDDTEEPQTTAVVPLDQPVETPSDAEAVERVSRYNFDELARILTDRVGDNTAASPIRSLAETGRTGALVSLGGETLVLNRLPLGILVFRDQQVLFANRAITEMVGYSSVEALRNAGLAAVFPAMGPDEGAGAGPVNHLVQRDGTLVPVTARLQSISWQGKPALMLSASTTEVRTGHEGAVSAFARALADLRGDGFFETTRAGIISAITPRCATLIGAEGMLEGKPLSALVEQGAMASLRAFLERPARFAETERPALVLRSVNGRAEIALFALGQAGVVTGYFGFVRSRSTEPVRIAASSDIDPALLARISRGVRRPLNTIIGFADLIRSEAFGALGNERYETYAQDITSAGQEIAALVDELDDFARLRDGRYLPQRASIELTGLLESCVLRIRQQASGARVIVRNAISENLPKVTADRASLAQAVLNLLASAIDQTPTGGGVVISAQREDDGGIAVHVRDSSTNAVDMAERFVVFRDGVGRDGNAMVPVRSSIGLALTRSLLAVNAFSLSVDPAGEQGMLFTMKIPADLVEETSPPQDETE